MHTYINSCIITDAVVRGMGHRPEYVDEVINGPQCEVNQAS